MNDYFYQRRNCIECNDLEVIRAIFLDNSIDTLMLCICVNTNIKDSSRWKLPQWDREMNQLFRREKCPLDWFKPDKSFLPTKILQSEKVKQWRAKVKEAETYWAKHIPELRQA
jgi:hypothetical protein